MRNPAENSGNPAETTPVLAASVTELFEPQIRQLGGVPVDPAEQRRPGRLWQIDPAIGEGTYWYFSLDDHMAVGTFDFALLEDGGFFCDAADCFYFGSYNQEMLPYLGIDSTRPDRTVVGHAWKHAPYHQRVQGGRQLIETFVALMPEALRRISLRLHCDPVVLGSAIASLDGTSCPAGLPSLLDSIRHARPSAVVAEAFYESKVVEACALIVDWRIANGRAPSALSTRDAAAVAVAQRLIQQDISRFITTEELCRATCMGASKLIELFKASCGMTPQEYARDVRMQRACELLESSDLPVAAVAARLGYARQSSFSEAFRAQCGLAPRAWRASARASRDSAGIMRAPAPSRPLRTHVSREAPRPETLARREV